MAYLFFVGMTVIMLFDTIGSQQTDPPEPKCIGVICPAAHFCRDGACVCIDCVTTIATVATSLTSSACSPNPCNRNCICKESCQHENGYYCESPDGYLGKDCDIRAPLLNCGNSAITMNISEGVLDDLFPWHSQFQQACFYLAPSQSMFLSENVDLESCRFCLGSSGFYVLTLPLPFDRCGTTRNISDAGYLTYNNSVWANIRESSVFDMPKHIVKFSCSYDREYSALTSLRPVIEENRAVVSGSMKLRANIELCKVSSACPSPCPSLYSVQRGAFYTVSETIHATITVQSTNFGGGFAVLRQMHISCSETVNDRTITLVSEGCVTTRLRTTISSAPGRNAVCLSFKVPRVRVCRSPNFFIHAEVELANEMPDCNSWNEIGEFLRKRSINDFSNNVERKRASVLLTGPIHIWNGTRSVSDAYHLFPAVDNAYKTVEVETLADSSSWIVTAAIVGCVGAVLFLASIVFCIVKHKHKNLSILLVN